MSGISTKLAKFSVVIQSFILALTPTFIFLLVWYLTEPKGFFQNVALGTLGIFFSGVQAFSLLIYAVWLLHAVDFRPKVGHVKVPG